jgi:hypothetical protein
VSECLVIDCGVLKERMDRSPDLFDAVHRWLRIHDMEPSDVQVPSEMVIEDSAFGIVIRYRAYLRDAGGHRYLDPDDPDRGAATADRTALLRLAPPADWLTATGGER